MLYNSTKSIFSGFAAVLSAILTFVMSIFAICTVALSTDAMAALKRPLVCPSGSTLDADVHLCRTNDDALGPFSPQMIANCKRFGGGDVCNTERWAIDFAANLRGDTYCPAGTKFEKNVGACADSTQVYGPFSPELMLGCRSLEPAQKCELLRWSKDIAIASLERTSIPKTQPKAECKIVSETLDLSGDRTLEMPAFGHVVRESHLATNLDGGHGWFPYDDEDGIETHLQRSCSFLKKHYDFSTLKFSNDCRETYAGVDADLWTPPESGRAGQGINGSLKPNAEEELWYATMHWNSSKDAPPMGTRFIMHNPKNKRSVVVIMGFESGPFSDRFIAGMSPEADWYLNNHQETDKLVLGRSADQTLPAGPIDCVTLD